MGKLTITGDYASLIYMLCHGFAPLHHGSRTCAKCLLRSRLAHRAGIYYI